MILPDVYGFVISELSSMLPTVTISSDLNGYVAGSAWVEVSESPGGVEVQPDRIYTTVLDFNCYNSTIETTRSLAMVALSQARSLVNSVDADFVVTKIRTETLPFKLTDLVNNQPRYIFSITVFYRTN